jgi:protein-L-isoaspartate(D-aspartate) O-methyltransferase
MFLEEQRREMVEHLRQSKIIISQPVYEAMLTVPRHLFMPESLSHRAYLDTPQPIDKGQTISAPHMNAMMSEYLEIESGQKILEIGTGSGYQAALLSILVGPTGQIFTIERYPELSQQAAELLQRLGYTNIVCMVGDGSLGLESDAPFDRIIVTAACPDFIKPLLNQLSPSNGIMCIPVGDRHWNQDLYVVRRDQDKYTKQNVCKVVFVPLIGEKGFSEE